MEAFYLLTALLLPILLGASLVNLLVPSQTTARGALVWGTGSILGLLLLPLVMRILDARGAGLGFDITAIVLCSLTAIFIVLRTMLPDNTARRVVPASPMAPWSKALYGLLLALIIVRLVNLGMEVYWRPLFPWDATMHWATKARVWFEYRTIVPFVDNGTWLSLFGEGVYTDRHPDYPSTIPLLQV